MYTVTVKGLDTLHKVELNLQQLPPKFRDFFLTQMGIYGSKILRMNVPKGARTNGLHKDIIHLRSNRNTQTIKFANPQNQAIAAYNEYGVRAHYVRVNTKPELLQWIRMKIPSFRGNYLLVGGPNSWIKAGHSYNRFMEKSLFEVSQMVPKAVTESLVMVQKSQ